MSAKTMTLTTTRTTRDLISRARFSALGSMRLHVKGRLSHNFTHLYKMDRSRAVYFTQEEQINSSLIHSVIINSYEGFKNQITARGNTVAHPKARAAADCVN